MSMRVHETPRAMRGVQQIGWAAVLALATLAAPLAQALDYAYGHQEKAQNVGSNAVVGFSTGSVHSDSGSCTQYYAGGWRTFRQDMELLPVTYTFHFNNGTPDLAFTVTVATTNHIR